MKKFIVPIWWYELHAQVCTIEAESKEEVIDYIKENGHYDLKNRTIDYYGSETFADFGDEGADIPMIEEIKESEGPIINLGQEE